MSRVELLADYDRVDQLINDKPHIINQMTVNIRKYIATNNQTTRQTSKTSGKRRPQSSTELEPSRIKQQRSASIIDAHPQENEITRRRNSSDSLIHELQASISTSSKSIEKKNNNNEIIHLQNEYECFNTQMQKLHHEQPSNNQTNEILNKLKTNVENLLEQIRSMQATKKTFLDQLFDKYTVEYILSLNENDVDQRIEQLERESQLLLLIKQVR